MFDMFDKIYNEDDKVLQETIEVFQEANIVRMDKQTLKKRLETQATLLAAKEANDPIYRKYVKATKVRRKCRKLIQSKYEAKGKIKVKQFLANRKAQAHAQATKK